MPPRVAVVTGSNRGIGYALVRSLAKQMDEDAVIYLTARNVEVGRQALETLKSELSEDEGAKLRLHQLDITDEASVHVLAKHLKKEHDGLDVLVNNAGFSFKHKSVVPVDEQAAITCKINYEGTKLVSRILFPLLRPHSRVVNISTQLSTLTRYSEDIQDVLNSPWLTVADVDRFVDNFIKFTREGTHQKNGYPNSAYTVSKTAVIALTFIQHKQLEHDEREDIIVNVCCPGWVATDMTEFHGPLTPEQGCDTPMYLALLPPGTKKPRGELVYQRRVIDWEEPVIEFLKGAQQQLHPKAEEVKSGTKNMKFMAILTDLANQKSLLGAE